MRIIVLLLSTCILFGCAHRKPADNGLSVGYEGPIAIIEDSFERVSGSKGYFFVINEVNGIFVKHSHGETGIANQGKGLGFEEVIISRDVPAGKGKFLLGAGTYFAADIVALFGDNYFIAGEIEFSPEPNRKYIVTGKLSAEYSGVWIIDAETKEIVSEKIEKFGE